MVIDLKKYYNEYQHKQILSPVSQTLSHGQGLNNNNNGSGQSNLRRYHSQVRNFPDSQYPNNFGFGGNENMQMQPFGQMQM